jgi:hypothetical protein
MIMCVSNGEKIGNMLTTGLTDLLANKFFWCLLTCADTCYRFFFDVFQTSLQMTIYTRFGEHGSLNTKNYCVFELFASSGTLEHRKHDVSETGSVSNLKGGGGDPNTVGFFRNSQLQSLDPVILSVIRHRQNPLESNGSLKSRQYTVFCGNYACPSL